MQNIMINQRIGKIEMTLRSAFKAAAHKSLPEGVFCDRGFK